MTHFLLFAAFLLGYPLLCWVWYLAVMNLKVHRDALSGPISLLAKLVLYIGLILDFLLTVFIGTLLFLSPPKEATATKRLRRHIRQGGWRASLATWICAHLLDPFDPSGRHCL